MDTFDRLLFDLTGSAEWVSFDTSNPGRLATNAVTCGPFWKTCKSLVGTTEVCCEVMLMLVMFWLDFTVDVMTGLCVTILISDSGFFLPRSSET